MSAELDVGARKKAKYSGLGPKWRRAPWLREGVPALCVPSLMDTHQTSTQWYKLRSLHNRLKGLGTFKWCPQLPLMENRTGVSFASVTFGKL